MRSKTFIAAISALAALTLLAGPAAADPAVVITDECGSAEHSTSAVAPGQDICEVSVETLQAGVDPTTGEQLTTVLAVTMTLAGDPQALPSAFSTVWAAGDCGFIPYQTDHAGTDETGALHVYCGERVDDCSIVLAVVCDSAHEFEADYPVDVAFGDDAVTWTITFDGPLGTDFADLHTQGSTVRFGTSIAGPSWTFDTAIASFGCSTDYGCRDLVGDFAFGSTEYTI